MVIRELVSVVKNSDCSSYRLLLDHFFLTATVVVTFSFFQLIYVFQIGTIEQIRSYLQHLALPDRHTDRQRVIACINTRLFMRFFMNMTDKE